MNAFHVRIIQSSTWLLYMNYRLTDTSKMSAVDAKKNKQKWNEEVCHSVTKEPWILRHMILFLVLSLKSLSFRKMKIFGSWWHLLGRGPLTGWGSLSISPTEHLSNVVRGMHSRLLQDLFSNPSSSRFLSLALDRWSNHVSPRVEKGPWSLAEELVLFQVQALQGNRWKEIARYLHGR